MANNKFSGYTPDPSKQKRVEGTTEINNRLDRINPYEFRKGMDFELTSIGCSRLAESTPEEREKATENVIKNLEEHQAYYSYLIQYETEFRNKDNKPTFKKYLTELSDSYEWKEVNKEGKDKTAQMTEPKYDKKDYTVHFKGTTELDSLKEAIKNEIKNILKEDEDKEPTKKDVKKAGMSLSKTKDQLVKLKDQIQSLKDKRKNMFKAYKEKIKDLDPDKSKAEFKKYADKQDPITKDIKEKEKEIKQLENTLEEARMDEREMRREAAKTMMGKDVHMEMLNIIKEAGVSLTEGSEGVKMYYEIAKLAYMEGLTAGMKKNI